jgi:uncharacterized protein (TIGR02231 family)
MHRSSSMFLIAGLAAGLWCAPRETHAGQQGGTAVAADTDRIEAASRVTSVTIFRDRARVTREAALVLPAGDQRVTFRGLPLVLEPDSARVSGHGTAGIVIRGLELRREEAQVQPVPDAAAIQAEIDDLEHRRALEQERLKSLDFLRDLLTQFRAALPTGAIERPAVGTQGSVAIGPSAPRLDLAAWRDGYDFLSQRLDTIADERLRLDKSVEASGVEIEIRHARLMPTASQRRKATWTADVLVSSPQGGSAVLALTYLSPDASWSPVYDARLVPAAARLTLASFGQILQTTGEDWRGVDVTLSSTQPLATLDLPRLTSLYLRAARREQNTLIDGLSSEYVDSLPIIARNYRDVLTLAPGVTDVDGDANPNIHGARDTDVVHQEVVNLAAITARPETRAAGIVYHLPGQLDIPSDGQAHRHLILERDLQATVEYQSAPAIERSVYLVARTSLPSDLTLLPGPVQHFVEEDLVGRSTLPAAPGGSPLQLGFGPEARLVLERREEEKETPRSGDDVEMRRRFATTFRNQLERPVTVQVTERLPISGDGAIRVVIDGKETTVGGNEDSKDKGVLRWSMAVPPSESRELVFAYSIRAPRGVPLELASARP